jgi:hypothetical protein
MSTKRANTREKPAPRWSLGRFRGLLPAPIAGLDGSSACVRVGPPLSASATSFGSDVSVPGGDTPEIVIRLLEPVAVALDRLNS